MSGSGDGAVVDEKAKWSNEPVVRFLDKLEDVQMIQSVQDERRVTEWVTELKPWFMESRSASSDARLERIEYYRLVLDGILTRSSMKTEGNAIRELFLVAGDFELTAQSLEALTTFNGKTDFDVKLDLLNELLLDDVAIPAALVDGSKTTEENENPTKISTINRNLTKERFLTRLINTPTLIANFAAGADVPAPFLRSYVKISYRNALRAFLVIADLKKTQSISYDLLGKFLSKVILNFSPKRASSEMMSFFEIAGVLCRNDEATLREPFNQLLSKVNNCQAIEAALICLLNHCRNWTDCLSPSQLVQMSSDWMYVVTTSLPLRSYVRDDGFPRAFVKFLSMCGETAKGLSIMEQVLMELVNCWAQSGDRPQEQHIFVSRLIIYLILTIKDRNEMHENLSRNVKQRIYEGIPSHLQSLDMNVRFVGMRMAEIVLNILESVAAEDQLDFGAAKVNVDQEVQQMFERFDLDNHGKTLVDEDDALGGLELNSGEEEEPQRVETQLKCVSTKKTIELISKSLEPLDSDDDEDDDLVPYDLSNDVSEQEVIAPKYLLDLKEVLVQSTDDKNNAEQFQVGVKVCAELIRNQLPLNDSRLGIELLSILINLNNKVYNEDFAAQRFEGCVAAVEVIPKQSAEYLCEEFYSEPGQYSISHRVLMLEILSEAARRLSTLDQTSGGGERETTKLAPIAFKKLSIKDSRMERKKEIDRIIAGRLSEKTRRFGAGGSEKAALKGINRFHAVAGSFVFPLINGFGRKQLLFQSRSRMKDDTANVLLFSFMKTLCVFTLCSENSPNIRKILQEVLHLIVLLKFYAEEKIQVCVLELVGCVIMVTPKQMMATDFLQSFLEIKAWLEDLLERNTFNPDMNKESKELAQRLLQFL